MTKGRLIKLGCLAVIGLSYVFDIITEFTEGFTPVVTLLALPMLLTKTKEL